MAKLSDGPEQYLKESLPYFHEKLGDPGAVLEHESLTICQCAMWMPGKLLRGNSSDEATLLFTHYVRLLMLDVSIGKVRVTHPITRLPYTEYLRMMSQGMFGRKGEETPIPTMGWLISLDDAAQWFESIGLSADFHRLKRAHANHRAITQKENAKKVENMQERNYGKISNDWRVQARLIADEFFDVDTKSGCRDKLGNYSIRVMEAMRERGISGPRGVISNPNTVMRDALQGGQWWRNKKR